MRDFVKAEKQWLEEVDDAMLNLVTQLKPDEARKVSLERIAHIEALAGRLGR